MVSIRKFNERDIKIYFIIFIVTFFVILIIIELNKNNIKNEIVVSKEESKIVTINNLNIGLYSEKSFKNLDVIKYYDIDVVKQISNLVYNSLFEYDNNFMLKEKLVETYAKIDEKNYAFKLKDNIFFQNGQALTSQVVKETIEKIYQNKESSYNIYLDNIQNVQIIDNSTFRINLIENDDNFIDKLIFPIVCDEINVGTGSYVVESFNSKNIVLKNKDNNQIIDFYIYDNLSNMYLDFKNKKLDIISIGDRGDYKNNIGEFGYNEKSYKGNKYKCVYFNSNEKSIFKSENLQDAIMYAINKKEIISKVYFNNAFEIENYTYDLDKSVQLLEEEKFFYKDGAWYDLNNNMLNIILLIDDEQDQNMEIANIIKDNLQKIGIKLKINIVSKEEYNKELENNNYDILILDKELENNNINEVNVLICNRLNLLYLPEVSGEITPTYINTFFNISTWKKIEKILDK